MNEGDFCASVLARVVEGEAAEAFRVPLGHDLHALDDARHALVLQHRVLA